MILSVLKKGCGPTSFDGCAVILADVGDLDHALMPMAWVTPVTDGKSRGGRDGLHFGAVVTFAFVGGGRAGDGATTT